eukprot:m.27125 g.27125  ORF g.27125 m.27125 type:complete len:157 (+) comp8897_c0_seq1:287-757(+)
MGKKGRMANSKNKPVHPNSRKAAQQHRSSLRQGKVAQKKKALNVRQFKQGVDLMWFREAVLGIDRAMTLEELRELAAIYIKRNDEQIAALKASKASQFKILELEEKIRIETQQFTSGHGVQVPDLTKKETVLNLAEWDGSLAKLPAFKMLRIKAEA